MKFTTVFPPQEGEPHLLIERQNSVRLISIAGWKPWAAVFVVAACVMFIALAASSRKEPIAVETAPTPSRVSAFDPSQTLKRGDRVVVNQAGKSLVGEVAARSMEPLLVKRGAALQAFFLAGGSSYVVSSGTDVRVVRSDEILATVSPSAPESQ